MWQTWGLGGILRTWGLRWQNITNLISKSSKTIGKEVASRMVSVTLRDTEVLWDIKGNSVFLQEKSLYSNYTWFTCYTCFKSLLYSQYHDPQVKLLLSGNCKEKLASKNDLLKNLKIVISSDTKFYVIFSSGKRCIHKINLKINWNFFFLGHALSIFTYFIVCLGTAQSFYIQNCPRCCTACPFTFVCDIHPASNF